MADISLSAAHPPTVLVYSRTEWLARSFESILAPHGCTVTRAQDPEQAAALFDEGEPDVVLVESDHGADGADALCRTLRAHPRLGSSTPVLVASAGAISRTERLAAMRAGAWDAFGFPLDPEELVLKVRALASVRREVSQAEERGLLDAATGVYNARGLARRAQEMVAEAYRHRRPLACVVFQASAAADGTGGGAAEALARLLRLAGRTSDVIGRVRRDEFAVLAPATGWDGAERLVERLGDTVQREMERAGSATVRLHSGRFAIDGTGKPRVQGVDLLVNASDALHAALGINGHTNGHGANGTALPAEPASAPPA